MAEEATRWTPQSLVEWQLAPTPQTTWLLKGLIPAQSIVLMSGPRKVAFKTWLAFTAAQSLASGDSVGSYITPVKQGKVLVVEEEGTTPDTKSRLRKIQMGCFNHDITMENPYDDRFLWFHHLMLKLDNPAHVQYLVNLIRSERVDLVVLDALTYMHTGDENSKRDMQIVATALMRLRAAGTTVMALVHTNKQSQREDEDIDLNVRGSSVMLDIYDAHLALRRHKETDKLWLTTRYRDHREQRYNVLWDIQTCDDEVKECIARTCNHRALVSLTKQNKEQVARDTFDKIKTKFQPNVAYTFKEFHVALGEGYTASRASEIRSKLLEIGLVKPSPNGKGVIFPATPNGGSKKWTPAIVTST